MEMQNWFFPLTLLPGVGLIIMSTTNWSIALVTEIDHLLKDHACDRYILKLKIKQLGLINTALVALYVSAAMCTLGGFIGSLLAHGALTGMTLVTIIVAIGIAALLTAAVMLIIYGFRAVRIKRLQFINRIK
ncbi:MAG: hypothetical protein AAFO07_26870 [Bacteroidota bacterium]